MKNYFIIAWIGLLMGCQNTSPRNLQDTLDDFEQDLLTQFPDYAAALGQETATEILILPTAEYLADNLRFCQKYQIAFEKFVDFPETPELNQQRKEKLELLNGMIKNMTGRRSPFNNLGFYNVQPALARRIFQIKNKAPDGVERLHFTLKKIPHYFALAKENLQNPDLEQTATAIQLQKQSIRFLNETVTNSIEEIIELQERERLEAARGVALAAVKDYHAFCNSIWIELKKLEESDS